MADLGKLKEVKLREVWKNEAEDFTPWLAQEENLKLLGETVGMYLELEAQEKEVGPFRADILCRDAYKDSWVLIENQLERTDHTHLGQLMTYAAGLDTVAIIWVAERFTEEHRAALDWLNDITEDRFSFFGLEVELWRIGKSKTAPKFNVVSKPNDWTRSMRKTGRRGPTEHQSLQFEYWTQYTEFMADSKVPCGPPKPKNSIVHPLGSKTTHLYSVASMFSQGVSGNSPELRVELGTTMNDPGPTFAWFEERKEAIEKAFGASLVWDKETYTGGYYRVYFVKKADMREREKWPEQHKWLREHVEKMYGVFAPLVKEREASET